ncbi:MAG: transcription antitermination factor NusB [Bacteroidota bacterium]
MLNRRHLRIKVLQSLYSYFNAGDNDYVKSEKELLASISKIYDLYLYYLTFFEEIVVHASNRIEESRNKKLPTREDLQPNLRFVENRVFTKLVSNPAIKSEASKRKISWQKEQDIVRKVFSAIRQSELYNQYMVVPQSSFEEDQEFAAAIFKDYFANSEQLLNFFEEQSIFWVDDIDMVCAAVIKTIKSTTDGNKADAILPLYKDETEDAKFVKDLFRKVTTGNDEAEKLISEKAANWELERIALMDMLLMKMAITEAIEFPTIPTKVTLNEYIEISKFYSTPKSNGFINGILDKIFAELKKTGGIKKAGRGLIED